MKDRANDILVDYEGLCGQLTDIAEVLELATAYNQPTASAIINTTCHALQKIITDHTKLAKNYRKGDTHD
ncbi:TPA: hypothetical protein U1060_001129 [Streptococcus suis]|nr:hypothetical protein [Streptococcus suis]